MAERVQMTDETLAELIVRVAKAEQEAEELREALIDHAEHQSWRCRYTDRYPWEPDCPCGLTAVLRRFNIEVTP